MNTELIERVRSRLAESGTDPTPASVATALRAESGTLVGDADVAGALRLLQQEFAGAGPLEPLLRDPGTTDVLVTAPDAVWVDRGDGARLSEVTFSDDAAVRRLAQRLALSAGRRLDDAQPYVDAWLPGLGGSSVRLHAVLPPVAAGGTCLSLRVLRPATHDLAALQRMGAFDVTIGALLRSLLACRLAFVITGGTGAGKTTLLAAMLGSVPDGERIVAVEEAGELNPRHPHVVRLVARPPNVEGVGEIRVRELVRQALRMRPDRLVVGEVRGAEVCDLLTALNTGHDGGAGTLHANSPAEVPARLEALAALGGLTPTALHSQLAAAVRIVLHLRRDKGGARKLASIAVLRREGDRVTPVPVWDTENGWGRGFPDLEQLLVERGGELPC